MNNRRFMLLAALMSLTLVLSAALAFAPSPNALAQGDDPTPSTDLETNKAVVERLIQEAVLGDNAPLIDELYTADFVGHLPASAGDWAEISAADLLDLIAMTTQAVDELDIQVEATIAAGDYVAQQVTMRGVFASEFFDTPPTGASLEASFDVIYRFEEGKIAEQWIEYDAGYLSDDVGLVY